MVGFDDDDRRFRAAKRIALECAHCGRAGDDVKRREHWYWVDVSAVLCQPCWDVWTLESVPPEG